MDRTISGGISLSGNCWHRSGDTFGLAAVVNGASGARQRFLDAGGLGILVGDGRLPHPGDEQIIESYYNLSIRKGVHVAIDYQRVTSPAIIATAAQLISWPFARTDSFDVED